MVIMGFLDAFKPKKPKRAKIIGVRTGEETKGIVDENFGIYSFLVEYEDESVGVEEAKYGSTRFRELMQYVIFLE